MHKLLARNDSNAFLDAFFEQVQQGSKRFLLCGTPYPDFCDTLDNNADAATLTIRQLPSASTDMPRFQNADDNALTAGDWDAVFVFDAETLRTHATDIARLPATCHLVCHQQRAERPIVVSLNKGGSNLVARLIRALGFAPLGEGIRESYAEIERLASQAKDYPFRGDGAMLPLLLRKTPPESALFFHLLPIGPHLAEWTNHPNPPPILFNYRDPRALLVSLIHYLTGQAREGFTKVPWFVQQSRMLSRLETPAARIDYATNLMGDFLDQAYRQHAWLLFDPAVRQTSYERLVGAAGGGDDREQLAAVRTAMLHFGVAGDPQQIANQLYSTDTRTFRKGNIASWKDEFSAPQLAAFDAKYRDILTLYGYE